VSNELGVGFLDFDENGDRLALGPTRVRSLFATPSHEFAPPGGYVVKHLYPLSIRPLIALIQNKHAPPTRAGNARARLRQDDEQ
jgi:hypothetical protein